MTQTSASEKNNQMLFKQVIENIKFIPYLTMQYIGTCMPYTH